MPEVILGCVAVTFFYLIAVTLTIRKSEGRLSETRLVILGLITGMASILYEVVMSQALVTGQRIPEMTIAVSGMIGSLPAVLMRVGVVLVLAGLVSVFWCRIVPVSTAASEEPRHAN